MFQTVLYQELFRQFLQKPSDCPPTCFVHYALDNKRYHIFSVCILKISFKNLFLEKKFYLCWLVCVALGLLILDQMPVSTYNIVFLNNQNQNLKIIFDLD